MGNGGGECVVGSDGHERRKKRKRKHEGSGFADGFASAGDITDNVKGDVIDESKRERRRKKKKKLELDNDRQDELEKHQKGRKKRLGDNDDIRSEPEGVNSKKKKKKKHEHSLGDDKGAVGERREIVEKGKRKKECSKQDEDEGTPDQLDSGNLDYSKEEEKKKHDKKRERKEKKKNSKKDKPVKESSRKVRFADKVEIFPSLNDPGVENENAKEKVQLVRGKHFSQQEDELVKKAVYSYIETHGLGEDGLNMVLHCSKHVGIRGCWKDIAACLPWRPHRSVYERAHVLFEKSDTRSWTEEEREVIKKYHAEHGSRWKPLADAMGRYRLHVNNMWRRMRMPDRRKGLWTQEEHQTLFDLVNQELQRKALEEKAPNYRMLRDNIGWEAISQKLSTRLEYACCVKWYHQLASPMVAEKIWADADDYRLLDSLVRLDACSMEEVDWDGLIQNRPGDVCRKRWAQMVRHIGEHRQKSFVEQVEILSQRYCPSLVEAREACDRKRLKN